MSLRVRIHRDADRDLQSGYRFYSGRGVALANDFERAYDEAVAKIIEMPLAGSPHDYSTRLITFRRFP